MTSVIGMAAYVKQELDAYEYQAEDLIGGVTPTLVDWTNDPTDSAEITDDNIWTLCNTGNKIAAAGYQYAYFEWDLGAFYNILCTGYGGGSVSAGTPYTRLTFWDGSAWCNTPSSVTSSYSATCFLVSGVRCSKVRIGLASSAAATVTPNIREFCVWRL